MKQHARDVLEWPRNMVDDHDVRGRTALDRLHRRAGSAGDLLGTCTGPWTAVDSGDVGSFDWCGDWVTK